MSAAVMLRLAAADPVPALPPAPPLERVRRLIEGVELERAGEPADRPGAPLGPGAAAPAPPGPGPAGAAPAPPGPGASSV